LKSAASISDLMKCWCACKLVSFFPPHTSWSNKLPLPNNLMLAMSLDHTQQNTITSLQTCIKPW